VNEHLACGKCGSARLLAVPPTPRSHSHIVVGERVMHTVNVSAYVCTDCGHVEQWGNSRADLERLRAEWARLGTAASSD
jgi:hypothetical protein